MMVGGGRDYELRIRIAGCRLQIIGWRRKEWRGIKEGMKEGINYFQKGSLKEKKRKFTKKHLESCICQKLFVILRPI